ncbi:MAG: response regulator [Lachnospiraceae bacterium]|nr:response regulator [Lachnospiraceae bacterium]
MFDRVFGSYIVKTGGLTQEELTDVYKKQDSIRVKLGLMATAEKLMTKEQADEVNHLQALLDKRFGDIAVEKGYLTMEQLSQLLGQQGNTFLTFIQTILDAGYMDMEQIEAALDAYQKGHRLTDNEMERLRSCNIDQIVSVLMSESNAKVQELVGVILRTLVRLVDNHTYVEEITQTKECLADQTSYQVLTGAHAVMTALCGTEESMKSTAVAYMGEQFIDSNDDVLDSMAEFVNCVNGLYATGLSAKNIDVELTVPEYHAEGVTIQGDSLYVLKLNILGQTMDYVISFDKEYQILNEKIEKKGRIFIVDDSRTARKVLRSILEEQGYVIVDEASNGEEALQTIPETGVDLVTLDITMPVMDGIEALKHLVQRTPETKVLMVSASAQKEKIMEALKIGACDFLQKPYDKNQVISSVKRAI